MNRITIVQARTGSQRLPGKALMMVGNRTVLEWVLYRVRLAKVGYTVVATTTDRRDDAIAQLCDRLRVPCYRGSPDDVLDRYHRIATAAFAQSVIRVTADCPLLCPVLLNETVTAFSGFKVHYSSVDRAPNGLAQEVISARALKNAWHNADSPYDREHVVTWTLSHENRWRQAWVKSSPLLRDRAGWRLTIDTRDDLRLLRRLHKMTHGDVFRMTNERLIETVEADRVALELATSG